MTRPCFRPQAWKILGKGSGDSEWEWKCACAQRSALGPYVSCHEEEGRRKLGSRADQAHNIRTLSITSLHRRPIRKMKNTEKADRGAEFEISERVRSWETEERKEELILFFFLEGVYICKQVSSRKNLTMGERRCYAMSRRHRKLDSDVTLDLRSTWEI